MCFQYEPEALSRAFMTEQDNIIRNTDMPERFQLRQVPVKETEEGELEEEAEWIYKQAFNNPPCSKQVQAVLKISVNQWLCVKAC